MKIKSFLSVIIVISTMVSSLIMSFPAKAMETVAVQNDSDSYKSNSDYDPCANGHNYKLTGWTWNGYESAYATFVCENKISGENFGSTHSKMITAQITSSVSTGSNGIIYTATVVCDGKTYTDTKIKQYGENGSKIIGDVDNDGRITSADALLVLRNSVGLEFFSDEVKKLADVDKDGKITSADSLDILRYSVGLSRNNDIGKTLVKEYEGETNLTGYKVSEASGYIDDELYSDMGEYNHIKIDDSSSIGYYDNEIAFMVADNVTEKDVVDNIINSYDVKIVGKSELTGRYLIRFENSVFSYDEILKLVDELKNDPLVENAYPNYVMPEQEISGYYPKGDLWEGKYDEVPAGDNWGVEAIKAPQAWNYCDLMSPVDVGVFEVYGFESDHIDLKNVVKNVASASDKEEWRYHGTHVTGIIGAEFDNGIGINGVCPTAEISYIDTKFASDNQFKEPDVEKFAEEDRLLKSYSCDGITTSFIWSNGFEYLIGKCGCKVVNVSMAHEILNILASMKPTDKFYDEAAFTEASGTLLCYSHPLESTLKKLLDRNKDFVICQGAGNYSGVEFIKDDKALYGYRIYKKEKDGKTKTFKIDKCDARFCSPLSVIDDKELKKRIIVVGGITNAGDGKFIMYSYSCRGNRVDVVAPATGIQSTYPDSAASIGVGFAVNPLDPPVGSYHLMNGTSVSAPHVSGVAAMLYSLNPDLDGATVRDIIVNSTTSKVGGYPFLNAEAAVNKILSDDKYNEPCMYYYSGQVVGSSGEALQNVKVNVYKILKDGTERFSTSTVTNTDGSFSFRALAGKNKITFEKDGYNSFEINTTFKKSKIYFISEPYTMQKKENYSWYLEPTIEAEDIRVLYRDQADDPYKIGTYLENGLLPIKINGKWGLVNYDGIMVTDAKYELINVGFGDKILAREVDEQYYYKDYYLEITDSGVDAIAGDSSVLGTNGVHPLVWVDEDSSIHVYAYKDSLEENRPFAAVLGKYEYNVAIGDDVLDINGIRRHRYVIVNNGKRVSNEIYEDAGNFSNGIIPVKKNGYWGYVNESGETIIPFDYDDSINKGACRADMELPSACNASDGFVVLCKESQYALYDVTGELVIPFGEFEQIRPVHNRLAWVKQNGKWGVIKLAEYEQIPESNSYDVTVETVELSNSDIK